MRLKIAHQTTYHYDIPVTYALQQLRMTPKSRPGQTVLSWDIAIEGGRKELEFDDQNNNHVVLVSIEAGRQNIGFYCQGEVETTDNAGVIGQHGGYAPLWYFMRPTALTQPGTHMDALLSNLAGDFDGDIARLHALSAMIAGRVTYATYETHAQTTSEQALEAGRGVCQDHAHVFVTAARQLGYPARYVSGYLMMDDRVEQDATHAWAEVHVIGIGWVSFDISNGISPDERYVRIATGLDYKDAAPISGMRFGSSDESMIVTLQVQQ